MCGGKGISAAGHIIFSLSNDYCCLPLCTNKHALIRPTAHHPHPPSQGMDLYFARHDGQAVTVEDFYNAMADANNAHGVLQGLQWWYAQAGTPTLKVSTSYDAAARSYSLTATQELPDSPRQPAANKHPQLIPLAVGLISSSGKAMPLHLQGKDDVHDDSTIVLPLRERSQTFVFTNVDEQPVPSLLRGFSAPVHLEYGRTDEELCFLLEHDSDEFCRWDAFQTLSKRCAVRVGELVRSVRCNVMFSVLRPSLHLTDERNYAGTC